MDENRTTWALHPQLAADTVTLGDLALCRALVMKDANYPWIILVPRRAGASEIIDLDEHDRTELWAEIDRVSRVLKSVTGCDKLNVAALGNMVRQLHVHVIARRTSDAAWPHPVWGRVPAKAYDAAQLDRFMAQMRQQLALS